MVNRYTENAYLVIHHSSDYLDQKFRNTRPSSMLQYERQLDTHSINTQHYTLINNFVHAMKKTNKRVKSTAHTSIWSNVITCETSYMLYIMNFHTMSKCQTPHNLHNFDGSHRSFDQDRHKPLLTSHQMLCCILEHKQINQVQKEQYHLMRKNFRL